MPAKAYASSQPLGCRSLCEGCLWGAPLANEHKGQQELERSLLLKQIARLVAEAKRNNKTISLTSHAASLFAEFPHAHLSISRIIDEIVHAAKEAGVPVDSE